MSVINKMLLALDERDWRSGGEVVAGDPVRSVKPASTGRFRQNVLITILGLVTLLVGGGWWQQQRKAVVANGGASVPASPSVAVATNFETAGSAGPHVTPAVHGAAIVATSVEASTPAVKVAVPTMAPPPALVQPGTPVPAPVPGRAIAAGRAAPTMGSASSASALEAVEAAPASKTGTASAKAVGGKTYSPQQLSDNWLGEAIRLDQQGRQEDAKQALEYALAAKPLNVRARQLLAQLQLDTGHFEQARVVLAEGQRLLPRQANFALTLARLQVEGGDVPGAIRLLEADRDGAHDDPQANALLGALLLRVERYDDAVQRYLVALRADPANQSWLVGVGVALEGAGKHSDAAEAYRRAQGTPNLTPETANFLSERLARLGH